MWTEKDEQCLIGFYILEIVFQLVRHQRAKMILYQDKLFFEEFLSPETNNINFRDTYFKGDEPKLKY